MKVVAIIQARVGSTRLPGKVLRDLEGQSVLAHVIERTKACDRVDEVVVATTTATADDPIEQEAVRRGARAVRGSEEDVLRRYRDASRQSGAQVVVRITSDCPLIDPELLCDMLERFLSAARTGRRVDYLSNTLQRTYPRGLDAEVFSAAALDRAEREAIAPHQREHVTPYIWEHPELFAVEQHTSDTDRSRLRWTLDTEEDWTFLTTVFRSLRESGAAPTTAALLRLLDRRPELADINAHVEQKKISI